MYTTNDISNYKHNFYHKQVCAKLFSKYGTHRLHLDILFCVHFFTPASYTKIAAAYLGNRWKRKSIGYTLEFLEERGYISKRVYKNGFLYTATDAGMLLMNEYKELLLAIANKFSSVPNVKIPKATLEREAREAEKGKAEGRGKES